jgi:MFS family permease
MTSIVHSGTWRDLWASRQLGRFILLCLGVWLHAADSLVTATIVPAMTDEIGGIAYVGWTISLYQVGAIVAAATTAMLCKRVDIYPVSPMAFPRRLPEQRGSGFSPVSFRY